MRATTRLGGYTPLHLAARSGDVEIAGILLDAGADPNAFTSTGVTAMHFAADADAAGVVEALVERGGEADARDAFSERTPLMFAAVRGAAAAARALMDAGADPSLQTAIKDYEAISTNLRADQRRRARIKAAEEPEEEEEVAEAPGAAQGRTPPAAGRTPPAAAPGSAAGGSDAARDADTAEPGGAGRTGQRGRNATPPGRASHGAPDQVPQLHAADRETGRLHRAALRRAGRSPLDGPHSPGWRHGSRPSHRGR